MHRDMVSSDIQSRRCKTARFRALNNSSTDTLSEPNRTRSGTLLRQRPFQTQANYERNSYSQSQGIPNQPSFDRRAYSHNFTDYMNSTKPRQSRNLSKEFLNYPPDAIENRNSSKWYMEPIIPFPCRSASKMEHKDHVERDCAMIKTSPILTSSPSFQVRQPISPAIKRQPCECTGHALIFQNQFVDKLSPIQRKTSLYSTNIKTLKNDLPVKVEKNNQPYKRQPYQQFCHHHHLQCHTPPIMKKWQLKENPSKSTKKEVDESTIHKDDHSKKCRINSDSNKNDNSTTSKSQRKLKDEDIVKVLELMVNKLVKTGAEVDEELLNELRISISGSSRDRGSHKRREASLTSSCSSSATSAPTSSTSATSESSDESMKNENFTNNKNTDSKIKQFRKQRKLGQVDQFKKENRQPPKLPSSSKRQSSQIQQPVQTQRCEDKYQSTSTKSGRSSLSSRRSIVPESIPEGDIESNTWNTMTIRKLKLAVDDLFENILDTIRTDHCYVASDISLERKESELLNRNNNNKEQNENNINHSNMNFNLDADEKFKEINSPILSQASEEENQVKKIDVNTISEFDQFSSDLVDYMSTNNRLNRINEDMLEDEAAYKTVNRRRDENTFQAKGNPMTKDRVERLSESNCLLDKANQTSSTCLSTNLKNRFHVESPKNFQRFSHSCEHVLK